MKMMTTMNRLLLGEKEVLELICHELTAAEIADRLYISRRTAEGHRNSLLQKTGCKNTAGLVIYAIRHNVFMIDRN
jgi:DNA-binding CsgD family transcriptional regulator